MDGLITFAKDLYWRAHLAVAGVPLLGFCSSILEVLVAILWNAISGSRGHGEFYSNFLTQNGSSKFEADGDGFGETDKEISANQVKSYDYRADGKIASFLSSDLSVNYFYDALDRLAAKMISQNRTTFSKTFVSLGDEDRILLGKAGDGTVTKYVQGQGVNEHFGEVKGTASKAYVTDHLGSVLNSEVARRWKTYGLFGEIYQNVNLSSTTEAVTFGFTGHVVDRQSGLNRTKHRQYDSEAGRWLSQDPIGLSSLDMNYYRYTANLPNLKIDPDGKIGLLPLLIVGGAVVIIVSTGIYISFKIANQQPEPDGSYPENQPGMDSIWLQNSIQKWCPPK